MVESSLLQDFHWLRPLWLLAIPLVLLSCLLLLRGSARNSQWRTYINPDLLPYLLQGSLGRPQRWPLWLLTGALIIASLAMAGPSWEKLPQPVHKTDNAMVILLDLSPSMRAEDIKPSRLVRARLKLIDLLQQRQEGLTALVAYAGEAYTVTPLTDDTDTIISLLPALSPDVVPLSGSNTEMALDQALKLFKDGGQQQGDILLVTDGVTYDAQEYLRRKLPPGFRLSILGVGTEAGAPIPVDYGGFAKNNQGGIVLAKLNSKELADLARDKGGEYRTLSHSDRDIAAFLQQPQLLGEQTRQLQRDFDTWLDRGAWLSLLLIPFVAAAFRRGWLLLIPLCLVLPEPGYAFGWNDLWLTPDQQGRELLQQDKPAEAAQAFKRQDWKATAQYRAQDYEAAAETYAQDDSATGHYNRGNALARAGKLAEAVQAYDQALQRQPDFEDASANKTLVEQLLSQNQPQPSGQGQDDQQNQDPSSGQDDANGSNQGAGGQQSQSDGSQSQENAGGSQSQDNAGGSQSQDNAGGSQSQDAEGSQSQENAEGSQSQENAEGSQSQENAEGSQSQDAEGADQQARTPDMQRQQGNAEPSASVQPMQEPDGQASDADAGVAMAEDNLSEEERQAMEQWLRKIPDDPSGLMRKKFEYEHRQRRVHYRQGDWQPPSNDANQRW